MPVLLVVTVGGSPRPIIESILAEPRPDRILFICSAQSREILGDQPGADPEKTLLPPLRAAGYPCTCGQYEVFIVGDPQDLTASACARIRRRASHAKKASSAAGNGTLA